MKFAIWITSILFQFVKPERAGITHCAGTSYPPSILSGGSATTSTYYMMQDPTYQFECCGVLNQIHYSGSSGAITLHIWRQNADTNFELVSKQDYTLSGSPFTPDDNKRVSFREGDLFGWKSSSGTINKLSGSIFLNWETGSVSATNVGDTHTWYSENTDVNQVYLIRLETQASTAPYFTNLPTTLNYADTYLIFGGITLMTLSYSDFDPDDAASLTVSLSPEWSDLFELTTGSTPDLIKTKESLGPGTYNPEFRLEEDHCGNTATATLTIIVTDSEPSIDNLPGHATVHEDDVDESLLYTVTMSDPINQGMWCRGDWTVGAGDTPFIVKMLSTTGGSSKAGIYLIKLPQLNYGTNANYELAIQCKDTFGHTVTGKFWVNVVENQLPIFSNIANMVEVDAITVGKGTTVFIVSTTDADNDQRTMAYTCSPASTCPLALYDSGEVQLTENVLLLTITTYTLAVTASDVRGTTASSNIIFYFKNTNSDPVLTNVNGNSVSVAENEALGKSLYQVSASDPESDSLSFFYMTINDAEGYDLFQLSTSGKLTTHSTYSIDYELLTTTSYTLTIYVNDGKKQTSETLTASVTNVNEAPSFLENEYIVTQDEAGAVAFTEDPQLGTAIDPDGDSLTYSRDCGTTSDSYISIDSVAATLSFAQEYDLDDATLGLPTAIQCTVYATDPGGLSDSTTLYINIDYANDNSPVFNPTSYAVTVSSTTPMGYSIVKVTVTDADLGDDSTLIYSLNQAGIGTGDNFIIDKGIIYAANVLTALESAGSGTVVVTAEDEGGNSASVNVIMTFVDSSVVVSATTDRNWEFIEDQRNITWLTMSAITIATCLLLIVCSIARSCMKRTTPLIDFEKLFPKPTPKRPLDKKRRKIPIGKQEAPQYRHVHANELLRQSTVLVASPAPVDANSIRADSATSGRVTVTEVMVNENEWMDGHATHAMSIAPMKSITHPATDDWEYLNPNRRAGTRSPNQAYSTDKASSSTSITLSKQRRSTSLRQTPVIPIPVSPSPVQYDNAAEYDEDFRSERISIASPSSQIVDEPIY